MNGTNLTIGAVATLVAAGLMRRSSDDRRQCGSRNSAIGRRVCFSTEYLTERPNSSSWIGTIEEVYCGSVTIVNASPTAACYVSLGPDGLFHYPPGTYMYQVRWDKMDQEQQPVTMCLGWQIEFVEGSAVVQIKKQTPRLIDVHGYKGFIEVPPMHLWHVRPCNFVPISPEEQVIARELRWLGDPPKELILDLRRGPARTQAVEVDRISMSEYAGGAFQGVNYNIYDSSYTCDPTDDPYEAGLALYRTIDKVPSLRPPYQLVCDVRATSEVWVLEPVKVELVGKVSFEDMPAFSKGLWPGRNVSHFTMTDKSWNLLGVKR